MDTFKSMKERMREIADSCKESEKLNNEELSLVYDIKENIEVRARQGYYKLLYPVSVTKKYRVERIRIQLVAEYLKQPEFGFSVDIIEDMCSKFRDKLLISWEEPNEPEVEPDVEPNEPEVEPDEPEGDE